MSKLVSIIMPTRTEQGGNIRKALASIKATATDFSAVEILLRIDDDDPRRLEEIPELEQFGAKAIIGPRGQGYNDMCKFVDDLALVATGRWSWLFDDDAWVEGPWQSQLAALECSGETGPACNAEFYQLGQSHYSNWPKCGPAGIIMPTDAIKGLVHSSPVDDQWLSIALSKNWEIRLLKDVTYFHEGRAR